MAATSDQRSRHISVLRKQLIHIGAEDVVRTARFKELQFQELYAKADVKILYKKRLEAAVAAAVVGWSDKPQVEAGNRGKNKRKWFAW